MQVSRVLTSVLICSALLACGESGASRSAGDGGSLGGDEQEMQPAKVGGAHSSGGSGEDSVGGQRFDMLASGGEPTGGEPAGGAASGGEPAAGGAEIGVGGNGGALGIGGNSFGGADASSLVSCDVRKITCRRAIPVCERAFHYPEVIDGCYGDCVSAERCSCTEDEDCPDPANRDETVCRTAMKTCTPPLN